MIQAVEAGTADLISARQAMQNGEFTRCLRSIADIGPGATPVFAEALLLRARALLALDTPRAVQVIRDGCPWLTTYPEHHAEAQILLGRALCFTAQSDADFDIASSTLRHALARAQELSSCRLQALAAFNVATLLWIRGAHQEADAFVALAASDRSPLAQARASTVAALLQAARRDYPSQLTHAKSALRVLRGSLEPDVALEATLTHMVAALGAELCDQDALTTALDNARGLAWTPDLRAEEFQTYRALGVAAALTNDPLSIARFFRRAIELAPSQVWKTFAHASLAKFLRAYGSWTWEAELTHAHDLARTVEWNQVRGPEQQALFLFIELFATLDDSLARHYASIVGELTPLDNRHSLRWDDRFTAHKLYAQGVMVADFPYLARRYLNDAWHIYDRIGYAWRAAETALAMAAVCDPKEVAIWTARAKRIEQIAPKSWIATCILGRDRASSPGGPLSAPVMHHPEPVDLTGVQLAVRDLLAHGSSVVEIAQRLGISRRTATRHVATIRRLYGADSRTQLISLLAARNPA